MPVYLAPFGFVLGLLVIGYGVKRPRSELADDRQRGFADPGWPSVKAIGFLPVPLARAVWVFLGLMIIAGSVLSVV
jgi:hypothetical protein